MSDAIFLWGKRGAGKGLTGAGLAQKYLREGRVVATNVDLFLDKLLHPASKAYAIRLPDCPTAADLGALPLGNPNPIDESRNGLLLLDEVVTFLDARGWMNKEQRNPLISWLAQSRKYGWDLCMMAQGPKMVDSQIRENIIEVQGCVRRLDKVRVPFLGPLWKHFTGKTLRFPRIHFVALRYGFDRGAPIWDSMWFRGADIQEGYDTLQKISAEFGNQASYSLLSPWHLKGRYMGVWELYRGLIMGAAIVGFVLGVLSSLGYSKFKPEPQKEIAQVEQTSKDVFVSGVMLDDGIYQVMLTDGKTGIATASSADSTGQRFKVDGVWYRKAQ